MQFRIVGRLRFTDPPVDFVQQYNTVLSAAHSADQGGRAVFSLTAGSPA